MIMVKHTIEWKIIIRDRKKYSKWNNLCIKPHNLLEDPGQGSSVLFSGILKQIWSNF